MGLWRNERKITMSMLDMVGRFLSGARPEVVTPATAPIISDILVECYLWAAKGQKPEYHLQGQSKKTVNEPTFEPLRLVSNSDSYTSFENRKASR